MLTETAASSRQTPTATAPTDSLPEANQLTVTPWSAIVAEYRRIRIPSLAKKPLAERAEMRRAVVALYWRHEGRATDGKRADAVVTQSSFARQVGLPTSTLRDWLRGVGTCINTGIAPREGFVRPMNRKLKQAIRAVDLVDEGTRQLVADDLAETQVLIDRLRQRCLNQQGEIRETQIDR